MSSDATEIRDAALPYRAEADAQKVLLGYKRTDVGFIPNEWTTAELLNVAECLDNLRVPLNETQRSRMQGDIPYCGANGVLDYVSDFVVDDDIILMAEDGGYFDEYSSRPIAYRMKGKCWVNNHAHILKATRGHDQGFLFYSLVHKNILPFLASGTRSKLNKSEMAKITVPVPPSETEQRAIAEALSDVDGLLGALEALIAKKRAIKQAAMQQLLTGRTRLPGFSGEWETKRLGEVADVESGATPSTQVPANWDGDIPWCTPTDITGTPGKYLTSTGRRITRQGLASCAASLLPRGALLLCSRATIGELKIATTEICTNQGFKSLVCKPGTSSEFLYYLLLTLKHKLIERASGSTFLEVGKRDVASIQALFPCQDEQAAIAAVLSDMDAAIAVLEARRDKTRAIKQGMMQQLLTGRIRLVPPPAAGNLK